MRDGAFWAKVEKTATCWLWTGFLNEDGYGRLGRSTNGIQKGWGAHRYSWTINRGPIPEGAQVLHKCDTRRCVNPDHLFLGDHLTNMRDMDTKGRRARLAGPRNPRALLTVEQVAEIRRLATDGVSHLELAKRFSVARSAVSSAICGEHWKDAPGPVRARVSRNQLVEFRGEALTLPQWATRIGIEYQALWRRLADGWSIERALTTPRRGAA